MTVSLSYQSIDVFWCQLNVTKTPCCCGIFDYTASLHFHLDRWWDEYTPQPANSGRRFIHIERGGVVSIPELKRHGIVLVMCGLTAIARCTGFASRFNRLSN
jgi:hypothetical protein